MTNDQLTAMLAQRVMGWRVGPDRFMMENRRWMPRWRFQPIKNLDNARALLDASNPNECSIVQHDGANWSAMVKIADTIGKAEAASQAQAITLAVSQAVGLDVSECE